MDDLWDCRNEDRTTWQYFYMDVQGLYYEKANGLTGYWDYPTAEELEIVSIGDIQRGRWRMPTFDGPITMDFNEPQSEMQRQVDFFFKSWTPRAT
jgi:hypothetical protein